MKTRILFSNIFHVDRSIDWLSADERINQPRSGGNHLFDACQHHLPILNDRSNGILLAQTDEDFCPQRSHDNPVNTCRRRDFPNRFSDRNAVLAEFIVHQHRRSLYVSFGDPRIVADQNDGVGGHRGICMNSKGYQGQHEQRQEEQAGHAPFQIFHLYVSSPHRKMTR